MFENDSTEANSSLSWSRQSGANAEVVVSRTAVDRVIQDRAALLNNGSPSVLAAPLLVLDKLIGVIYLESTVNRFDEDHLQFVAGVAGMASVALHNVHRLELLEAENRRLRFDINLEHNMVGESPRIREVFQFIARAAPTTSTVLIRGESGTVRNWWHGRFISIVRVHKVRSWQSTVPRSRRRCSKANCSATKRAHSPAPLP
jgi:transcriptional regulator with GAF, ATPase, and Fis domain